MTVVGGFLYPIFSQNWVFGETRFPVEASVSGGSASVLLDADTEYTVEEGMILRIGNRDTEIEYVRKLATGESSVSASVSLPDGTYEGEIVTESVSPISFLVN